MRAQTLDARRVTQIEAVDLEPAGELGELRQLRVAPRRVGRKARRHDHARAATQELLHDLVPDLDAPAGDERDAAAEIAELRALPEVELRARSTHRVVEGVHARVGRLAHVAVARGP